MKKYGLVLPFLLFLSCAGTPNGSSFVPPANPLVIPDASGGEYDPGEGYVLVWKDEFDGPDIDTSVWSYETRETGWRQSWNSEWQLYTDNGTGGDNAYIQDGILIIQAKMTGTRIGRSQYTSARMVTKDRESWQYGKIAARMALPYGNGVWPAFWMLGDNFDTAGWPSCGEIDIMEMIGGQGRDNTIYGTLHWRSGNHAMYGLNTEVDNAREFHIYEMEWTEESIRIGVDGNYYYRIDITPDSLSEFHRPFYLLFNLAVGGRWGGYPDRSTAFPQYLMVDWVRVYQIPE